MKLPITVLVQTLNEERAITACLQALHDFDEVIVVDSCSTDRTVELAAASGASVARFRWNGEYPKKKQWQLDNVKTRNDWVFFLDADERPSNTLIDELKNLLMVPPDVAAFELVLDYWFAGKKLAYGHRVRKRALLDRTKCWFEDFSDENFPGMGELEGHYQPHANGSVQTLNGRLEHEDVDPVATWFDRHNRYSSWEARLLEDPSLAKKVNESRSRGGQIFSRAPLRPLAFFLYSFVVRLGFLDGRPGFDYSIALSFYYWQIGIKRRESQRG